MPKQIELTNLAIKKLCKELNKELKAGFINKIQETENNWLKIKIHTKAGTKQLIAADSFLFLSDYSFPAKMQTTGFGALLNKKLYNKKILKIEQYNTERILLFEFENFLLIMELFAKGNIALCNKQYEIIAIKRKIKRNSQILKPKAKYLFPEGRKEINNENFEDFYKSIKAAKGNIVQRTVKKYNLFPLVAEEICQELGIDKNNIEDKEKLKEFFDKLKERFSKEIRGEAYLLELKNKFVISLFRIKSAENLLRFETISKAIEFAATKIISERTTKSIEEKKLESIKASILKVKRKIEELEKSAELNKRKAETIYNHYVEIAKFLEFLKKRKIKENSVMYKKFPFLKKIDLKDKKAVFEFD
ncbi:MAG: NFACT family protein [Candidatus Diapherotrites archaeon]|nr:NFACT family protein [Candidatus Diapherotrites archaeon]